MRIARRLMPVLMLLLAACLLLGPACVEPVCAGECGRIVAGVGPFAPAAGASVRAATSYPSRTPADGPRRRRTRALPAPAPHVPLAPVRAGALPLLI